MVKMPETFEGGFRWGFYVREYGKVTRASSDEEFRKALNDAWKEWNGEAKLPSKSAAAYLSDEEQNMVDAATAKACGFRLTKHQRELAARAVAIGLVEPEPPKSKIAKKAKSAAAGRK